jgi:hypothetical protein
MLARSPLVSCCLSLLLISGCAKSESDRVAPNALDHSEAGIDQPAEPMPEVPTAAPTPLDPTVQAARDDAVSDEAVDAFTNLIVDAASRSETEIMAAAMGDPFLFALWRSEGTSSPPREAAEMIVANFRDPETPIVISDPQPEDVLDMLTGGGDGTGFWGPDVEVLRELHTSGWGADGAGDAMIVIAKHPSLGTPYWHALLLAPAGFAD